MERTREVSDEDWALIKGRRVQDAVIIRVWRDEDELVHIELIYPKKG